jgi:hypothetical protein
MFRAVTAAVGLSLVTAPDVAHYLPFLKPVLSTNPVAAGLATILAPAVGATLFIIIGLGIIHCTSPILQEFFLSYNQNAGVGNIHGSISVSGNQLFIFRITFFVLTAIGAMWLVLVGAILFSMQTLSSSSGSARSVASGAVYMGILAFALIINVAIIFPACLLLQPIRLWRVLSAEKQAETPRQRFRGMYIWIVGISKVD